MADSLTDYIRESFASGLKKPQIEANLLRSGWTKEQIADAFERIEYSQKEFIEKHRRRILPSKKFLTSILKIILTIVVIAAIFLGIFLSIKYVTRPKLSIIAGLRIAGDQNCVTKTNEAINLLRDRDPDNYEELASRIDLIKCDKFATRPQYNLKDGKGFREFRIDKRTMDAGAIWYAGIIVHETCHARQFQEFEKIKYNLSPEQAERERNKDLEAECAVVQAESLKKLEAEEYMINHVESSH